MAFRLGEINHYLNVPKVWPRGSDAAPTDPSILDNAAVAPCITVAINELSARLTAVGCSIVYTVTTQGGGAVIAVSHTRRWAVRIELKPETFSVRLGLPVSATGSRLDNPIYTSAERAWRWLPLEDAAADSETQGLLGQILPVLADST